MAVYAVGSAYLFRQSAGSERLGGLEVTIRPRKGDVGGIVVELTEFSNGESLDEDELAPYVEAALKGIDEVAKRNRSLSDQFDVQLSKFLYHAVDIHPKCYFQAGKSAYRAALEAWQVRDLDAPDRVVVDTRYPTRSCAKRFGEGVRSILALARKLLKCRFSVYRN